MTTVSSNNANDLFFVNQSALTAGTHAPHFSAFVARAMTNAAAFMGHG